MGPTYLKPSSSKRVPGTSAFFRPSSSCSAISARRLPVGSFLRTCETSSADALVDLPARDPEEVARHRPDVRGDRHLVVVQDDDELPLQVPALVQPLHRDAAGESAVADDGDDVVVLSLRVAGRGHAERRRDRRRGVGRAEDVVLRLRAAREAREAPLLPDRVEPVPPPRQDLVRVALVTDVPDEEVAGRVEDVVERDRQLDRPEARGEVPARLRDGVDQEGPELVGERRQLLEGEVLQVPGPGDPVEERGRTARHKVLDDIRSPVPVARVLREGREEARLPFELPGPREGRLEGPLPLGERAVDAEDGDVGQLLLRLVLPDALPEDRGRRGDVEEVVGDLEEDAEGVPVEASGFPALAPARRRGPRRARTTPRGAAPSSSRGSPSGGRPCGARPRPCPDAARSSACPPAIPSAPIARARTRTAVGAPRGEGLARAACEARTSKPSVWSVSPARSAIASPCTTWQVGLPRRSASSSMQGRSSWISE